MFNFATITRDGKLPSRGKIYGDVQINPDIVVRSMTTNDEMKRLSYSTSPYKILSEVLNDCCVEKDEKLDAYNMWMPDFQYLMFLVRIATYGGEIHSAKQVCPHCGQLSEFTFDLNDMLQDEIEIPERVIELPNCKAKIEFNYETPHIHDNIENRTKELNQKYGAVSKQDLRLLVELEAYIKYIDGEYPIDSELNYFIRNCPMQDMNYLTQKLTKCNSVTDIRATVKCEACGGTVEKPFIITPEFFRPEVR